jgi:hypothetical protein
MNRWLLILMSLLLLTGCGPSVPKGVIVTGKFTKGGAPVAPAEDGSSTGGQAPTDATGAFRIEAGGRGVPPGKYRVQLSGESEPGVPLFENKYGGENFVKEVEVPADKLGGEFDLGTIELDSVTPMSLAPPSTPTP